MTIEQSGIETNNLILRNYGCSHLSEMILSLRIGVGHKPNSVPLPGRWSSIWGDTVAGFLKRPTRGSPRGPRNPPIWSCSGWGLPDAPVTRSTGELLPHHFTLTTQCVWRYVSVALSFPSPGLCVTEHLTLWSSDFPPAKPVCRRPPGPLLFSMSSSHSCRLPRSRGGRPAYFPPLVYELSHGTGRNATVCEPRAPAPGDGLV